MDYSVLMVEYLKSKPWPLITYITESTIIYEQSRPYSVHPNSYLMSNIGYKLTCF